MLHGNRPPFSFRPSVANVIRHHAHDPLPPITTIYNMRESLSVTYLGSLQRGLLSTVSSVSNFSVNPKFAYNYSHHFVLR